MHMHRIFNNIIAEIISFAITDSWFYACACHPHREAAGVMIAALIIWLQLPL